MKVTVRGESEFGLPKDFEEVELQNPTIESIMDYFHVDPKIRKHLFPIVNSRMGKLSQELQEGDKVI
ncbi:MAG: hypothetical protein H8D65_00640, partial [Spirochaetes bacterium]|nr:hypothetical protein [Spirochaetota bacterium]